MKIIIESKQTSEVDSTEVKDSSVAEATMRINVEGSKEYGNHASEAILGILMNAFIGGAEKFVKEHPCKDCTTYVMYSSMLRQMQAIQYETMKYIGKEDLLDALNA